jgi:hypothetical protein
MRHEKGDNTADEESSSNQRIIPGRRRPSETSNEAKERRQPRRVQRDFSDHSAARERDECSIVTCAKGGRRADWWLDLRMERDVILHFWGTHQGHFFRPLGTQTAERRSRQDAELVFSHVFDEIMGRRMMTAWA